MPWIVLIQHMLDQSRFPDDLKTNLLKEIARMDKPNVEVLLNMLKGLCPIRVMSNFDFFNPGR